MPEKDIESVEELKVKYERLKARFEKGQNIQLKSYNEIRKLKMTQYQSVASIMKSRAKASRLACCTGSPKNASVLGFYDSKKMSSTIKSDESVSPDAKKVPFSDGSVTNNKQQIKDQYKRAKELIRAMSKSKDMNIRSVVDQFKYIIETNEKYNHEILEELTWYKKTSHSYKYKLQKNLVDNETLKF